MFILLLFALSCAYLHGMDPLVDLRELADTAEKIEIFTDSMEKWADKDAMSTTKSDSQEERPVFNVAEELGLTQYFNEDPTSDKAQKYRKDFAQKLSEINPDYLKLNPLITIFFVHKNANHLKAFGKGVTVQGLQNELLKTGDCSICNEHLKSCRGERKNAHTHAQGHGPYMNSLCGSCGVTFKTHVALSAHLQNNKECTVAKFGYKRIDKKNEAGDIWERHKTRKSTKRNPESQSSKKVKPTKKAKTQQDWSDYDSDQE